MAGEAIRLSLDEDTVELLPEEIDVETVEPEDTAVVEDAGYIVAIDTVITESLRKEAGYQVEDHIRLGYKTEGQLAKAINQHMDYLKNEVLADEISANNIVGDYTDTFTIGDKDIQVTIERI